MLLFAFTSMSLYCFSCRVDFVVSFYEVYIYIHMYTLKVFLRNLEIFGLACSNYWDFGDFILDAVFGRKSLNYWQFWGFILYGTRNSRIFLGDYHFLLNFWQI